MGHSEEPITSALTPPSEEQAARFTRELDYPERMAGHLFKASGTMNVALYSLKAAIDFLSRDNTADTVAEGAQFLGRDVDVAYIKPQALARWVREAIGDAELADAIELAVDAVPEESGYPPARRVMHELMAMRFLQCMEVLGVDPETGEDAVAEPEQAQEQGVS